MNKNQKLSLFFLWLLLGSLAAGICALGWPSAHLGKEYLPVGHDSFYHARRILDAVQDPASFYQFDKKIHAPDGSLLTWPWGYDYALAWLVRAGVHLGLSTQPMEILIWIPVITVFLSIALILLLAQTLSLSRWSVVLAGLGVALSPLTQLLHTVGMIDHHYVEYIFVLATLTLGLRWLSNPHETRAATCLGIVLGSAPAIHNGLFILQVPVLATLILLWIQGKTPIRRPVNFFCFSLISATILVLIPSLPFRLGHFEFYTLSCFHLYIACTTALLMFLISRRPYTYRTLAAVAAIALLALIPLLQQIGVARGFLGATIVRLNAIGEMQSLRHQVLQPGGPWAVTNLYTLTIWLWPITLTYCVIKCWQERAKARLLFWIASISGLVMLAMQFRLHYFGSFALFLPWLIFADGLCARWPQRKKLVMLVSSLCLLLLYGPAMRYQLSSPAFPANDESFVVFRPMLTTLQRLCASNPGVVLADNDAGHYIRYYTDCPVIANNFLLTAQHEAKIREMDRLMGLPPDKVADAAPYVKYILVRPLEMIRGPGDTVRYVAFNPTASGLVAELLMKPVESLTLPNNFKLVSELRRADMDELPYARLFEISR